MPMMATQLTATVMTGCFACGAGTPGLRLQFSPGLDDPDSVFSQVVISPMFESYPGVVHGGIVATLLDAAMTHCLFAKGIRAMTASLNIRYRHPLFSGSHATVQAILVSAKHPVYELKASIRQENKVMSSATARFYAKPNPTPIH
jgi:uncharacterized protein (TIGR00369 family)